MHFLLGIFDKTFSMSLSVDDLEDQHRYRLVLTIPYKNLVQFVFEYLKKRSGLTLSFWAACLIFLCFCLSIRIDAGKSFQESKIFLHSVTGAIILPLLCIPVHEFLHIIPFWFSGAKSIRVGMDLSQFLFYVTAHRHVTSPRQFVIVALIPFLVISITLILLICLLQGLWKWSLSLFLFAHATMCAGDFALLNFYWLNRDKKIYTWDDADKKEAYFYEEIPE